MSEPKKIELQDGKSYEIKPSYWTMMVASEQLNKGWSSDNALASIAANVFACILLSDEKLTLEAVAKIMPPKNSAVVLKDVTDAIEAVMADAT